MKNPYELAKNILQSSDQKEQPASSNSFTSIDLYGAAVHEKGEEEENCSSFHLENESGVGDITLYHVFPGIELVYNDMHMASGTDGQCAGDQLLQRRTVRVSVWRASVLLYVCRRSVVLLFAGSGTPVGISDGTLSWDHGDNRFFENYR